MLKKEISKEKENNNEWTKLKNKKKGSLPPPPEQEASRNLQQIEIPYSRAYRPRLTKRTGRVVQFATRVTPEFDKWIRNLVQKENIYLAEMLERMMLIYQKEVHKYNFQHKNDDPERKNKIERSREKGRKNIVRKTKK